MSSNDAYQGDLIKQCQQFNFANAYAVVVSGASWNPCGHLLLNTGDRDGYYFHVAEIRGRPRYMDAGGYKRYMNDNGKRELSRTRVEIPHPMQCNRKLEELLSKTWAWWLLPNNCASFVEDVVQAGGSSAGLYFNCPSKETFR